MYKDYYGSEHCPYNCQVLLNFIADEKNVKESIIVYVKDLCCNKFKDHKMCKDTVTCEDIL